MSNNQSFESMMEDLETIVRKLDNETVPLEEALELYQKGMKLSASCDETLKNAEKKVNELMKDNEEETSESSENSNE